MVFEMTKISILPHACWASAVVAAFVIGSSRTFLESNAPAGDSQVRAHSGGAVVIAENLPTQWPVSISGTATTPSRDGGLMAD